jgi:hypothetical protein
LCWPAVAANVKMNRGSNRLTASERLRSSRNERCGAAPGVALGLGRSWRSRILLVLRDVSWAPVTTMPTSREWPRTCLPGVRPISRTLPASCSGQGCCPLRRTDEMGPGRYNSRSCFNPLIRCQRLAEQTAETDKLCRSRRPQRESCGSTRVWPGALPPASDHHRELHALMREHCPAVVHVDGTARPQLAGDDNPALCDPRWLLQTGGNSAS